MKPEKTISRLQAGQTVRIAALGDSLTYGWMADRGYIEHLQQMLKERYPAAAVSIVNRGIPGDTARGGLERLDKDIISEQPDMVFVQFGLNDAFCGCPAAQYGASIRRIAERLRQETQAEILLVTSVALADLQEDALALKFYEELEAVSRELSVPVARVHAWWKEQTGGDFKGLLQADLVHPTSAGYRLMAEAIMQVLV